MPGTENSNSGPVLKGSIKETDLGQEERKDIVVTGTTGCGALPGPDVATPEGIFALSRELVFTLKCSLPWLFLPERKRIW